MSLAISENAKKVLKELLENTPHQPTEVIRFVSDAQGDGLILGKESDGDHVLKQDGHTIMVVERSLSNALSHRTLDVREGPQGYRWNILPYQTI